MRETVEQALRQSSGIVVNGYGPMEKGDPVEWEHLHAMPGPYVINAIVTPDEFETPGATTIPVNLEDRIPEGTARIEVWDYGHLAHPYAYDANMPTLIEFEWYR